MVAVTTVPRRPFIRDAVFFVLATGYLMFVFYKRFVNVVDAVGFLALYAVYVSCVRMFRHARARHWVF